MPSFVVPLDFRDESGASDLAAELARGLAGLEALHTSILALAPEVPAQSSWSSTGWRGSRFAGAIVLTSSGLMEIAALQPLDISAWAHHLLSLRPTVRTIGGETRLVAPLLRELGLAIGDGLELKVLAAKRATGAIGRGSVRLARATDFAVASAWLGGFFRDTSNGEPSWVGYAATKLIDQKKLFFWSDGGPPLSMVAVVAAVPGATRLSLAYTPPPHRGCGYATNCMRAITRRLLADGAGKCCVHVRVDAGTPQRLYRRSGYGEIGARLEATIA